MLTVTSRKRALKGYDVSEANPVMCLSCQVSSLNLIKKKKKAETTTGCNAIKWIYFLYFPELFCEL